MRGTIAVRVLALGALALAAGCGGGGSRAAASTTVAAGAATVVSVIDGDTLVADIGGHEEHLRLIGIDTPETHEPDAPVECYGAEAAAELASLLPPGAAVRLERDIELRDVYGRVLAYVYRQSDDLFVNLDLAARGFAAALTIEPNTAYRSEIDAAVGTARAQGLGLWGACGGPDTPVGPPPSG
jgi:micrococcal nuclease